MVTTLGISLRWAGATALLLLIALDVWHVIAIRKIQAQNPSTSVNRVKEAIIISGSLLILALLLYARLS
jgi:hypothetical protein